MTISLEIHERRTNAAKRRDVGLALAAWPELSDRTLAGRAGVSHELVRRVRRERARCQPLTPGARRIGADGRSYPATRRRGVPARGRRGGGLGDGPPTAAATAPAAAAPGSELQTRTRWDRLPPAYI